MADEESIFLDALAFATPAEREAYLQRACGDDRVLKQRVQTLLDSHALAGSILDGLPPRSIGLLPEELADEGLGARFGPYKLLELIGEGGMGLVYMAQQEQPIRRKVALKILKPGMDTRQVLARFEAERHALALLDHPGIAKVLDAGTAPSGRPYFVMELVRGISIDRFCDEAKLNTQQRLELFVLACQAAQHAHERGIIHRDLKPANILVTVHDEVPVPKIIDFGIAKATQQRLVEQTLFTNFLQMIGTPAYMSPEQAELSSLEVDARSDVYSLGVLLYELLTGGPPFESQRLQQVGYVEAQRIVREEEPARPSIRVATLDGAALSTVAIRRSIDPRHYAKSLRGDLDWIVMRALEKDRNRRYESAAELAADVRRYLQCAPVRARRPTTGYRLRKFVRRQRNRLLLPLAAVCLGALFLSAYVLHERNQRTALQSSRELVYVADIQRAATAVERGRYDVVERDLAAHEPKSGQADLRGFEWYYLSSLCSAPSQVLGEHQDQVFDVTWSPSGKYLATSGGDYRVIVRDGKTGVPLQTLDGFPDDVNSIRFLRDEALLAAAEETGEVSVWNWREGRIVRRLSGLDYSAARVFLTADPDVVIVTDVRWDAGALTNSSVWRLSTGERLSEHKQQRTLAVDSEHGVVAHRDYEYRLGVNSLSNLEGERLPSIYARFYEAAAFSNNGELLAAGAADGSVELWRMGDNPRLVHVFEARNRVRSVAFSPKGQLLAAGSNDGVVRIWDLQTLQEQHILRPERGAAWKCEFSTDGSRLAIARDRGVEIYELAQLPPISRLVASVNMGAKVWAYAPSRNQLAVAGRGGTELEIRDAYSGGQLSRMEQTSAREVSALAFASDGRSLWIGGSSGRVCRLDLDTMTEIGSFTSQPGLTSIAVSPDGRFVGTSPDLNFWDAQTLQHVDRAQVLEEGIMLQHIGGFLTDNIAFLHLHPGSKLEFWDLEAGRTVAAPFEYFGPVGSIAVSPDGSLIAISTAEPAIHLWDTVSGQTKHTLLGHGGTVEQLAFSPDGLTLASMLGGEVRLWNVATGQQLLQMPPQRGKATILAFSGDSRQLIFVGPVTGGGDDDVLVWGVR